MTQSNRRAIVDRKTTETQIHVTLDLEGSGKSNIATGAGFLDHMLELFTRHCLIDLNVKGQGDLHVDSHHTVEDVGITVGQAFREALGDKQNINRYGHFTLPMDDALVTTAVDLSGRSHLVFNARIPSEKIGEFDSELVEEFFAGFARSLQCNLHIVLLHGRNSHHIAEAIFKSVARSMRMAIEIDPRGTGVPSTKGSL
jgi:imidazoleglycerol-phosphate dehydratase